MILPLLLALLAQDADALVNRLRADKIEDRESATRRLRELGKPALPALEKVLRDPDQEVAERARYLIDFIRVQADAPANLRREFPDLAEELSVSGALGWREMFIKALHEVDGKRAHPLLEKADLEYLAAGAIRGCRTAAEKVRVCQLSSSNGLEAAVESYLPLLEDKDPGVRHTMLFALGQVGSKGKTAAVARLLRDPEPVVAAAAVDALVRFAFLGEAEAAPALRKLLAEERPEARALACEALGRIGSPADIPELARALSHPDAKLQLAAARGLCRLGDSSGVPLVLKAADDNPGTSLSVLNAVREPEIWKALRDEKQPGGYLIQRKAIPDILPEFTRMRVTASIQAAEFFKIGGSDIALRIFPHRARSSLDLVQMTVDARPLGTAFDFVLEPAELRVMRDHEARRFWAAWWASKNRK